jgi:secreted trypsin-like serine protease
MRLIVLAVATALLAAAPACAQERGDAPVARIVNGHAPTQAWPAQTSVRFTTGSGTYVCGGTLLSARWVLTAGHCATGDTGLALAANAFSLRVGSTSRTAGGTAVGVDDAIRQPGYADTGTPTNDLALLHLATAVTQEPLRLAGTGAAEAALWSAGAQATIVGWGVTEAGTQSVSLREAQVAMVGDGSCAAAWGSYFSSTSMVCAGGQSTDSCSGDSGGPLMVPRSGGFELVGVVSWGSSPCGQLSVPGVYARVGAPALNAWVRSRVPTAGLAVSPAAPDPGEQVGFIATVAPGAQVSSPTLAWDLDDDGAFDDATGTTAGAAFVSAGTHVVRVQATFPDGDRAVAREAVPVGMPAETATIAPATAPQTTTTTTTTATQTPQLPQLQLPQQQPSTVDGPIGSVSAPERVKLQTLRAKSLRVRFDCARACTISGRLTLDGATARRFGLASGGSAVTIGRGSSSLQAAGSRTLAVSLTAKAKRALRNRTRATVRLATDLRAGAWRLAGTQKISVSR